MIYISFLFRINILNTIKLHVQCHCMFSYYRIIICFIKYLLSKNPLVLYIHVVLFVKSRKLYCALRHSKNVICQSYMIVSLKIFSHRVNWESFFKWHGKYSSIFKIMAKIRFFYKSFYRMQHINVFNEFYKKVDKHV